MTSLPRAQVPLPFDEFGYGMLVADGLGDTESGEIASRLAIRTFVYLYLLFGRWNLRIDERIAREVVERAERFYRHVDGVVTAQHRTEPASPEMQTTLTAIYSAGSDCLFAARGALPRIPVSRGELAQLTRDHTLAAEASVRDPEPSGPSAARDMQHILTDAIGSRAALLKVDVEHFQLLDGDVVLLCTERPDRHGGRAAHRSGAQLQGDARRAVSEPSRDGARRGRTGRRDRCDCALPNSRREQGSAGTRAHTNVPRARSDYATTAGKRNAITAAVRVAASVTRAAIAAAAAEAAVALRDQGLGISIAYGSASDCSGRVRCGDRSVCAELVPGSWQRNWNGRVGDRRANPGNGVSVRRPPGKRAARDGQAIHRRLRRDGQASRNSRGRDLQPHALLS